MNKNEIMKKHTPICIYFNLKTKQIRESWIKTFVQKQIYDIFFYQLKINWFCSVGNHVKKFIIDLISFSLNLLNIISFITGFFVQFNWLMCSCYFPRNYISKSHHKKMGYFLRCLCFHIDWTGRIIFTTNIWILVNSFPYLRYKICI